MNQLIVSPSPHIRGKITTTKIMLCVLVSLLPTVIAASVIFGLRSLLVVLCCVASCVLSEYVFRFITGREQTVSDLSAAVTGVILALNLPHTIPLWMASIGSVAAIVVVKQFFGGIGQNFANPAVVGRIVLMLSFAGSMTGNAFQYDGVTGATPLSAPDAYSIKELFLGTTPGCMGETCALTLIIGGLFLVITKVITPTTPLAFCATVAACSALAGENPAAQVLSGGLLLGAIFMATDYATTPVTQKGKLIFGIGCGLITFVIRQFSNSPEGVSYSILLMNILTPYIDILTPSKAKGAKKPVKEEGKS